MEDHVKVMTFLGCTEEEAHEYLQKTGGNVLRAIEDNVNIPVVSGAKYIPAPRQIDDGLTSDVRDKLRQARTISEQFSASFRNDLLVDPMKTAAAAVQPVQDVQLEAEVELPVLVPDAAPAS
jgi:hypothetical protein